MESSKVSDLVRKYFAAYESKDRKVVEDTLSDSFTFTSPYDDHIGRRTYFDRCWSNSDKIRAIHIEKLVERGDDVFVLYTCELTTGTTFRNTEYLRFEGGKLREVEVYFGSLPQGVVREEP
ncbi:MAG: nuclear transport factor 2 family protein [Burkholderiales bacterium]|jgi:ketosteroid isomerase-like protein